MKSYILPYEAICIKNFFVSSTFYISVNSPPDEVIWKLSQLDFCLRLKLIQVVKLFNLIRNPVVMTQLPDNITWMTENLHRYLPDIVKLISPAFLASMVSGCIAKGCGFDSLLCLLDRDWQSLTVIDRAGRVFISIRSPPALQMWDDDDNNNDSI